MAIGDTNRMLKDKIYDLLFYVSITLVIFDIIKRSIFCLQINHSSPLSISQCTFMIDESNFVHKTF